MKTNQGLIHLSTSRVGKKDELLGRDMIFITFMDAVGVKLVIDHKQRFNLIFCLIHSGELDNIEKTKTGKMQVEKLPRLKRTCKLAHFDLLSSREIPENIHSARIFLKVDQFLSGPVSILYLPCHFS